MQATRFARHLASASLVAALAAAPAATLAQDYENQVEARQGQFKIMAVNLGVLGGMARGQTEYDAAAAQTAADNLVAISGVSQQFFWPQGSDNFALDTTRADPAIWENMEDFQSKWAAFGEAAAELQTVAGEGSEGLGAAVGALGGACKSCHDDYRGPELE